MSTLIPFQFESHALRVQVDEVGQSWLNASDACAALELGNPRQALDSHVDAEDVQKLDTLTPGGRQRQNHVNESGLYALILCSTKDSATRFKRWVTSEVLPAIRKTGAYSATPVATLPALTQDRVSSLLLVGDAVAKVPGVKAGIAMAATLTCIQEITGLVIETLRRALPAANEPTCSHNATQLGKLAGSLAKATNQRLATLGFQFRNERDEWELTDAGKAWVEAMPFSRNGQSGHQILWNPAVVEQLKEVA